MENMVAQMLTSSGHNLYFFSNSSEKAEDRMEIDFLLQKDKVTSRHNIRPIEVKSGKNYTMSSINKAMRKFSEHLTTPTIIHTSDLKIEGNITYLPIYMTPLLEASLILSFSHTKAAPPFSLTVPIPAKQLIVQSIIIFVIIIAFDGHIKRNFRQSTFHPSKGIVMRLPVFLVFFV